MNAASGRVSYHGGRTRFLKVVFSFACLLWFAALAPADEPIQILAFEYPPYYQDEPLDKGLSCEIVQEAFSAAGLAAEFEFLPVRRMVDNTNGIDMVCSIGGNILFRDLLERDTVFVTEPIQYVVQTFMYDTRKYPTGISYTNLAELKDFRIGVLDGSGIMQFLRQTPSLNLVTNTIHEGLAKQLYGGRVDIWAVTDLTGVKYMNSLFPEESGYYSFSEAYNLGDISVAFNKKHGRYEYYLDKFREGLARIKADGRYMELMIKYYGSASAINPDALSVDMKENAIF